LSTNVAEGSNKKPIAPWQLAGLAVLATLWGLSEMLGGPTLRLTATALVILAVARIVLNVPGTSLALAGIAVLFRSVNAAPHHCHLVGIGLLGAAFDVTATLLIRQSRHPLLRCALTGATAALLSALLFAATMTWVVRFRSWPEGGLERVGEHVLASGGPAAMLGLVLVPAGVLLGHRLTQIATRHPRQMLAATATGCVVLWALGPFVSI